MSLKELKKSGIIAVILFSGLNTSGLYAQTTQPTYVVNEKTAEAYTAENPGWLVNVDEAYALSKKTGKPIMANFTGSDWCGWCKRLTANVFSQDAFKQWAEKNVILLELDFPRKKAVPENIKAQNAGLQQAFQVSGFPTVWVFNLNKDEATNQFTVDALGKTGFTNTVEEFTSGVEQMMKK
jgi:thiol:disulfide interchange protein